MFLTNEKAVCDGLGVGRDKVREWREMGMPYYELGAHSIRYDFEEVTEWVKANFKRVRKQARRAGRVVDLSKCSSLKPGGRK